MRKIPAVYKNSHWRNTTRVFEASGDIGFGLTIAWTDEIVRYKLSVLEAQSLAESLLEHIANSMTGRPIQLNLSGVQQLIVCPIHSAPEGWKSSREPESAQGRK